MEVVSNLEAKYYAQFLKAVVSLQKNEDKNKKK